MPLRLDIRVVQQAMQLNRISQVELSILAGLHRNSINRILKGTASPTLETVDAIARALDVSPFVLLTDKPEESQ